MKNIEIKTAQNVVLQYELADLRDRIIAFLIDQASLFFGLGILMTFLSQIFSGTGLEVVTYLVLAMYVFYSPVCEALNSGQTLGKTAMRIQVIRTTSGQASISDYAARWVFRLVDIFLSFGGIASILIASSAKSQRIGDIVANTTVIKLTSRMNLDLKDILQIHARGSYTPQYLQAKQLIEDDALLIKSALDRYRKYNNPAHLEALNMLTEKIAGILHLNTADIDRQQFLETVLKDYVMLTR